MKRLFGWYRPESDHYLHLDLLRFIASAAVVLFHYRLMMDWRPAPALTTALDSLRFAVDLFFVISGVVMADLYGGRLSGGKATNDGGYGAFLRRRFARLAPLHYATLAFYILLAAVAGALAVPLGNPEAFEASCIPANLLFLQSFNLCDHLSFNGPSWSISAEVALYVLLPGLLAVAARRFLALTLIAAALAALFALRLLHSDWTAWTFDFGVLRAAPSFLLGLVLARSDDLLARLPRPRLLLGLALLAFVAAGFSPVDDAVRLGLVYLIVILALASDRRGLAGGVVRGAAPLGRLTYSLYMLHMPVAIIAVSAVGEHLLGLNGAALNGWIVAVALTVLPVAAVLSFTLFETPLRRWLAGGSRRAIAPAPSVQRQPDA